MAEAHKEAYAVRSAGLMPFGVELSLKTFDRATRIARGLVSCGESIIILMKDGKLWRSRFHDERYGGDDIGLNLVLEAGDLVWVEDGRLDPRFARSPLVAEPPHLRCYIGVPIRLADGSIPGALVVVSTEPQPYDPKIADQLVALSEFVADEWARAQIAHEHRESAKALESTRTTLEALVASVPISLVITDRDLKVRAASRIWAWSLGLQDQDYVGRSLYDLAPGVYTEAQEDFETCLKQGLSSGRRVQTRLPSGYSVWLQTVLTPWYGADGEVAGVFLAASDVSELVAALEQSERSEERLKLALSLADIHVYEIDYVRRELIKAGAEDTFFDRPKTYQDLYRDIYSSVDPRDVPTLQALWEDHLATGRSYRPEYRVRREDGREVWAQGAVTLFSDETGRPLRLVGAMRNITEQKRAELVLKQAREEAELANRAKSAFLATMSHEIRTPLNGVLGMAQAMAADRLDDRQRERLDVIRQSGETLLAILNDILDLSKIEAGKLELEETEFDLESLARGAHAAFTAIANRKGLSFALRIAPGAAGLYRGDPTRVRQILYNLISNALKFTERGEVAAGLARVGDRLEITVRDTGIGIAADSLAKLFQPFEQADTSMTRRFGGTGLGLAICRQLTDLMGGGLEVESTPGEGSTFRVTLPLPRVGEARSDAPTEPEPELTDGAGLKVLAAEDNEVNQLVLRTLLHQIGVEPKIVGDGEAAVAAWTAEPWDVILMDVQMPKLDGLGACREIRRQEVALGRPRTPIIALTANAMQHQVIEYEAAGMDGFVAKPIHIGALFAALQTALDETEQAA